MSQSLPQRVSPAALRLWLKERVYDSRALRYTYSSWTDLQSGMALLRNHPYEAAGSILRGWRLLGENGIGKQRSRLLMKLIHENCFRNGALGPAAENRFLQEFIASPVARNLRSIYAALPREHCVRLRLPNDDDPERQGDLIILKPFDKATGERGVIMLMYSESILAAAALFDITALASRYMFVLEPSWWGYQDARFLLYLGSDLDVLVQSPRVGDFDFIASLQTNLVPTRVGAGEWGDPNVFRPRPPNKEAAFDAVMVSAWDPLKRHEVFFQAAAQFKQKRRRALRFALIGYDLGWKRETIEHLLRQYGLESDCSIYENIRHAEVAEIVADSKMSLLLSRREGANRAIYESMFCNTPIIVYRHQCGVNLDHVNDRTGLLANDAELTEAICYVLDHCDQFDPRAWANENAGYDNSTRQINEALSEIATRRRLPWTRGMVAKKSAPNLRYAIPGLYKEFESEYERLGEYLLAID